jgi:hypothetical protein
MAEIRIFADDWDNASFACSCLIALDELEQGARASLILAIAALSLME